MSKSILYFFVSTVVLIILVCFQSTLFELILKNYKPNFLIIFTIYLALYRNIPEGGFLALFAGYLQDAFSGSPMGFYMFSFVLVFFSIKVLSQAFFFQGFLTEILSVFVGSILFSICNILSIVLFTDHLISFLKLLLHTGVSALFNTVIAYLLFPVFTNFDLHLAKKEKKRVVTESELL